MSEFKHGTLSVIDTNGAKDATQGDSQSVMVYVGTAPVHTVRGGAKNVNKPILCRNIAEARAMLGYSDAWEDYTLCEAMHAHLVNKGVGPLVFINVLDPAKHKSADAGTAKQTPVNGRVTIAAAQNIIADSVKVTGKELDTDYTMTYDYNKGVLTLAEVKAGSLGTEELTITYNTVDPSAVTKDDVIGATDDEGLNTGLYAVRNVYNLTGYIPAYLFAPGFSTIPAVHSAMIACAKKINGHWDAWVYADLPLVDEDGAKQTLTNAPAWKKGHGYTNDAESVYFPMAEGTDGRIYHISVLSAANLHEMNNEQGGIPYNTPSNKPCTIIKNLYMGEDNAGRVYDEQIINEKLNKYGINSAVYSGGQWVIWGGFAGSYDFGTSADNVNVCESNLMMLFYLGNDFQHRNSGHIDQTLTISDFDTIKSIEQTRIDALIGIGALCYGNVYLDASADARSDMMNGDYAFSFEGTVTPKAKSMGAHVSHVDDGYAVFYATEGGAE